MSLTQVIQECFGKNFSFYPALQGRAAERMLLQGTFEAGLLRSGDCIASNRPFDTTKGHITALGLHVEALTPLASPDHYIRSNSVFLGNIAQDVFSAAMCQDLRYRFAQFPYTGLKKRTFPGCVNMG